MDLVVVVIDPQKGWLNQYTRPTLHALAEELSQSACWPSVVLTQFINDVASPFRSLLPWWKGFQKADDTDLMDEFMRPVLQMFTRNTYGLPPELWACFESHEVKQILLTGVETDATIVKTAMDAFDRGISVWAPWHLVASTYGPAGQASGLAILQKVLGQDHLLSREATRKLLAGI